MNITSSPQISEEVKEEIVRKHIEPSYIQEISKLIKGKRDWKLVGQIFETTSKALVAIGGIVSFAAGSYGNFHLSFVAGAVSTISLATLSFSSFGYKEQKKQGLELNNLLKKLKLDEVPINERNVDDLYGSNMRQSMGQTVQHVIPPGIQHEMNRMNDIIVSQASETNKLIEEIRYLKGKEKPYANDQKLLKEKLVEVLKKPPLSRVNTPIEDPVWLKRRIEELEAEKEKEDFELRVHQYTEV